MLRRHKLERLSEEYAIWQQAPLSTPPAWAAYGSEFVSVTRTDDELSIICRQEQVPPGVTCDGGWTCLKLVGQFAFDETGIVLSIIKPISEQNIGVLVVSTFNGDHILVKTRELGRAVTALTNAGHEVRSSELRAPQGVRK